MQSCGSRHFPVPNFHLRQSTIVLQVAGSTLCKSAVRQTYKLSNIRCAIRCMPDVCGKIFDEPVNRTTQAGVGAGSLCLGISPASARQGRCRSHLRRKFLRREYPDGEEIRSVTHPLQHRSYPSDCLLPGNAAQLFRMRSCLCLKPRACSTNFSRVGDLCCGCCHVLPEFSVYSLGRRRN
jgi:hypothetical protein